MTPPHSPPFTTVASFGDLVDYLHEEGVAHSPDPTRHITEIPTRSGALAGAMYVRWEPAMPLVQVIQVAIVDVPADRLAAVEQALALINHAAPLAGFALDREHRFVYFRITLMRDEHDRVAVPELNRALRAAVVSARDYLPVLRDVTHISGSLHGAPDSFVAGPAPASHPGGEPVSADPAPGPAPAPGPG